MNPDKRPHILLVDDDKDMCESLADVITLNSDYRVSFTTSPLKALDIACKEHVSLIVTDYIMPQMDGIELIRRLHMERPGLPVFILTAFISNELIEKAKKEGAVKVLSKFIWPDEIVKHITEFISPS